MGKVITKKGEKGKQATLFGLPPRKAGEAREAARWTNCPLCFKDVPTHRVQSHVDACVGASNNNNQVNNPSSPSQGQQKTVSQSDTGEKDPAPGTAPAAGTIDITTVPPGDAENDTKQGTAASGSPLDAITKLMAKKRGNSQQPNNKDKGNDKDKDAGRDTDNAGDDENPNSVPRAPSAISLLMSSAGRQKQAKVPSSLPYAAAAPFRGAIVLESFVTAEEEAAIVAALDAHPWRPATRNGRYASQLYGRFRSGGPFDRPGGGNATAASRVTNDRGSAANKKVRSLGPFGESALSGQRGVISDTLPPWALEVGSRIAGSAERVLREHPDWSALVKGLDAFRPNQANANSYSRARGDSITAHMDDRSVSGPFICNLTLLAGGRMTYTREKPSGDPEADTVKVEIPRRSMHIMTGPARWSWKHAVLARDLDGERRISVTFRMV